MYRHPLKLDKGKVQTGHKRARQIMRTGGES